MRTTFSRIRRFRGVPLVAGVAALAFAAPALAAGSWHPITGTCYENGNWFTSSNVRTVSSGGSSIRVKFNDVPSKGMAFRVINYNTGAQLGSTVFTPPLSAQTLAGNQPAGRHFVNSFRLEVSGHQTNYSFDGSELY
jgi:hypothetical protein